MGFHGVSRYSRPHNEIGPGVIGRVGGLPSWCLVCKGVFLSGTYMRVQYEYSTARQWGLVYIGFGIVSCDNRLSAHDLWKGRFFV